MIRKYLAIGGPADGKLIEFDEELEEVYIPVSWNPDGKVEGLAQNEVLYTKLRFSPDLAVLIFGDDKRVTFFPFEGEFERTLRHLIDNYRPTVFAKSSFQRIPQAKVIPK